MWLALLLLAQEKAPDDLLGAGVQVRARAWHPIVVGGVTGEDSDPEIHLDDDLNIDSPGWIPMLELAYLFPPSRDGLRHAVAVSGWSFATSGEERLDEEAEFEGSVFPAGSTLRSRFRFMEFGVDGVLTGREDPRDPFRWRFSVGLHYLEAEVRLSGATGRESEEYSDANLKFSFFGEWRPVEWAFVGGSVAAYTDFFSLLLGVDSGHYAGEFEAFGGLEFGPLRLEGGFRVFAWTLAWTESEIDLVAYGPWAGLTLRF